MRKNRRSELLAVFKMLISDRRHINGY